MPRSLGVADMGQEQYRCKLQKGNGHGLAPEEALCPSLASWFSNSMGTTVTNAADDLYFLFDCSIHFYCIVHFFVFHFIFD